MKKSILLFAMFVIGIYAITSCGGGDDPFAESANAAMGKIHINGVFEIIAEMNEKTRTMYTKKIVGLGKEAGLAFHEDWQKDDVEAGPLPALFLRGTSEVIQKSEVSLGLYLGSDFPIRRSNMLKGVQAEKFAEIRKDSKPQFFYDEPNKLYTAMFADIAGAKPCVSCHNDHENTTKTDWAMGDIMGATTWTYPKEYLTMEEVADIIRVYRLGVEETYKSYLAEVQAYKENKVPEIGEKWSDAGYAIPDAENFLKEMDEITAPEALTQLISLNEK